MKKLVLDEKTLENLMKQYTGYVYTIVKGISCDCLEKEDMEEIVSDVFFSLWKSQQSFENHNTLKPYLAQIARNQTRNRLRENINRLFLKKRVYWILSVWMNISVKKNKSKKFGNC